ncbi:alpha/beta fold hydrolase [Pseudoclavibacter chungangensis]|uniref:Alpha/beta fold hydrolase n=1 Tax=Pseudoclavibacter chungangensis TaxID=587635 RepID=A0A7J5BZ90_9MICO|nr:alpha/beta hydrolase [Pseudoclavibacter chungangensis]KAB1659673.1 alpha/beta fold hydrolase [Pseudoclavibacter chungangensis]NYJ67512.1 putative alpha/beta hydrolase [Pseudoclavibacter chungangensis]
MTRTDDVDARRFTIEAANGERIVATRFDPAGASRGIVLVAAAIATRASYYAPLAQWIASTGRTCVTFDYQGYGASADGPIRDVRADQLDWASDAGRVLAHLRAESPETPITWIGHSLGGQLIAFAPHETLDRAILIGSGTGSWHPTTGIHRVRALLFWYAIALTLTRLHGYFPGRRYRLFDDLPPGVIRQWIRWGRHPDYLVGVLPEHAATYAAVTTPLDIVTFTDDETIPETATAHLARFYANAPQQRHRIDPAAIGERAIGHMGFFRRDREALWDRVLTPLLDAPTRPRA